MLHRVIALVALAVATAPARGDGPADNRPGDVRDIPPPGIEVDPATRHRLLAAADGLDRDTAALAARDADRAEVLVFARAVRRAIEDRFLYSPQEVERAEALLARGQERLAALAAGGSGLGLLVAGTAAPDAPRVAVGGFRSRLDGSVQPYGLVLPAGANLAAGPPRRLDVWLHGRGEKVGEVAFLWQRLHEPGPIAPTDTIVLHPYGRYSNAFKFAGEVDVLEAIDHVKSLVPIDANRIVIRGFSMGGAGCWQLAVHHPGTWLAATPGAGFSETRDFLRVFQGQDFRPTEFQAPLLRWYDCPDWANNLRHLPVIAYSGEIDRQKQAADAMVAACRERGFDVPHLVGPQTGHKIHPDCLAEIERRLGELARAGRPAVPREIDFTTFTLRYPRHSWLTIQGLGAHWQEARVRATLATPRSIDITTGNVTRLRLDIPRAPGGVAGDEPVEVRIDGSVVTVPPAAGADRTATWTAAFAATPSGWTLDGGTAAGGTGLRKRPGLQGPIDDAFLEPFLFVGPDAGGEPTTPVERWVGDEYARAKREWRRHFRGDIVERRSAEVSPDDIAARNLILFGTPESNPLLATLLPDLPVRRDGTDWVIGGHRSGAATSIPALIYPNPLNPDRYVVLNSGFTFREYAYLNNARQVPMLPDWALVSAVEGRGSELPGTILAAGFFNEAWRP